MTGFNHEIDLADAASEVARQARTTIPDLSERITSQVQQSVRSYAGPATGRRRRLIEMAVTAAVSHFLDDIEKPGTSGRRVDELFRRMGHGEATDGHELDAMQAAFHIACQEAWELIRPYATERSWSANVLGWLGDSLFSYIDHLSEQTALGYDAAVRALDNDPVIARERLLDGLFNRAPDAEIAEFAGKSGWLVPSTFIIVRVELIAGGAEGEGIFELTDLPPQYLARADGSSVIVVADPDDEADLLHEIDSRPGNLRIAKSWPIPGGDIPDACRWTARALRLVADGVIAATTVVDCGEHRIQLWLHSEPGLRQRLCQDLLRPLLAETPNSREILSETLLAWLESRDSAPAIAARLGVHPQTVRYRWKRINELFGDELRRPEFVLQATMVLKASIPLWKAGDQSDFERFRIEDGS